VDEIRAVVLVGFMGAGKTSVGQVLAQKLGWEFEDLDNLIQQREGRTIEQIFHESGEASFRGTEHAALRELLAESGTIPRVIALGGGAFVQTNNVELLKNAGVPTVFLDGPAQELFARCQQQGIQRPLRRDPEDFGRLYETRRPKYLLASLRIETSGKSVERVASEVTQKLGLLSGAELPPGVTH
jgi:shikimate kinase